MGILNVTPDSFSDGSRYNQFDAALAHAEQMIAEGADIIDIGGESTRPGASDVEVDDEIKRVIPLIEHLKKKNFCVSIDTSKPLVMQAAAEAGADMINDVRALSLAGAAEMVVRYQIPVCLMHMQGKPRSMQNQPQYQNVVQEVFDYLQARIEVCEAAGIETDLISIDPGFGFGKTLSHNLELLNNLDAFHKLNKPILAGLSRKRMIGDITGRGVNERLAGSLAMALIAMQQGAKIIRVHDVKETVDVKNIYQTLKASNNE